MAKPSSIPRKTFRATSTHQLPSSPLRPKVLPRSDPALGGGYSSNDEVQGKHRGKERGEEDEDEDDFNPFTSHKSHENPASTSSTRQISQSHPTEAESSLWLFNEDRGADSTNIMQNVMAPWGMAASEDEDMSLTHMGTKLQRASSSSNKPNGLASRTRSRALSPADDMASRLLSPTHKLTRQLYRTNSTTRRPLSSHILSSPSSKEPTSTKFSDVDKTTEQAHQQRSASQSPAPHINSALPDRANEVPLNSLPPPSAMKNPRGTSLDPPKSIKKARFADSDENVNRFTASSSGSTGSILGSNAVAVPASDSVQALATNLTTGLDSPLIPKPTSALESTAAPSDHQQTVNSSTHAKSGNRTVAPSSNTLESTSMAIRFPTATTEPPNKINSSPINIPPTLLSPERPLASRLQSSGTSRSSRALSVEILSVNPLDKPVVKDPMEKVKIQQQPLSSFKRLSRTHSANSKVFQTNQATPTSALQRASSISNADMLRPSRVVRSLASLSGVSEPDLPVVKPVEARPSSSIDPSSGPSRLVSNNGKDGVQVPPSGRTESSERKKLPGKQSNLSSEDEGLSEPKKDSTSGIKSRHLSGENQRPSNRIHVSERAGSRLSALIELPTPNSTVEAISSGELEGVAISSNLSMVCQNGGVPRFSTPYSAGPVSLPLPPDTIHLSASRVRRSGRKSLAANRDSPSRVKPLLAPLTFARKNVSSQSTNFTNQSAPKAPPSRENPLASRDAADLPDLGPTTQEHNASETAVSSHSHHQNDMMKPSASISTLDKHPAPGKQDFDPAHLPLPEVKKGKEKAVNSSIDSESPAESQAHSVALKKGRKEQAQANGKMNEASTKSNSCRPSSSLCKLQALEQQAKTARGKSTTQDIYPQPEVPTANTITPAPPISDTRPPSPPHLQEASDLPAPVSRLTRVTRPPPLDPAVLKKSSAPSLATGESSRVPSNQYTASSLLDGETASAVSKRSRHSPAAIDEPTNVPSNQFTAADLAPTKIVKSASDVRPSASVHTLETTSVLAPVSQLVRGERPSSPGAESAAVVSKRSRTVSLATGKSSKAPIHQSSDASAQATQLVGVKRPSALNEDPGATASKKSRVPSTATSNSTRVPSRQSTAGPPPIETQTASAIRPSSPSHLPEATDPSAPVSQLLRAKRPSLGGDPAEVVSKKSRVALSATGESFQAPDSQSTVGSLHPITSSTAKSAPDDMPSAPPHQPETVDPSAPVSQLVRVKRPSTFDGHSAAAVLKESRVPASATGDSSQVPNNPAGNPHRTVNSTARSASDVKPSSASQLPEAMIPSAPASQLGRVKRPPSRDGDSAALISKKSRVPSSITGDSSKIPSTQSRTRDHSAKASGPSRKPSSSQSISRVRNKGASSKLSVDASLPSRLQVDKPGSSDGFLSRTSPTTNKHLPLSDHPKCIEPEGGTVDLAAEPAESHSTHNAKPLDGESADPLSTKHSAVNNHHRDNPERSRLGPDKLLSSTVATLADAARVPGDQVLPSNIPEASNTISPQINIRASSTDSRCTVLLEVPSNFDASHPAVESGTSEHAGALLVPTSSHQHPTQDGPSGSSNSQSEKTGSLGAATKNVTSSAKPTSNRPQAPILTLPKEFDFVFRSTMPNKPRIKDTRAQTDSSVKTNAPSRRPPVPAPSQTKPLARSKPLTRSRPEESDAERAPKRSRNNLSSVASPSRTRIGLSRPGLNNRVRSVVGRLNSLAKNASAPVASSIARGTRPKPPSRNRANEGPAKIVGPTSQFLAADKTVPAIPKHTTRAAPMVSAHQSSLRSQLMKEIRQKAGMHRSKHGEAVSDSIAPAPQSSSGNVTGSRKTSRCLADIPEETVPNRVVRRNVSCSSSSKMHNSRAPEAKSHQPASQNSRTAFSGFQSCLNQWREVEARQSTSSLNGSLGHSVQSRKLPEWQDVSLVHHILPVKDHSKPKKPVITFGLATERRILEREHWEQTKANKEKIEAEIRAQQELKAQELEREEFIRMRRECVVKANPVPSYLKKHH